MNSFAEFNYIYTIQQVKRRIISSVVPLQKLLEVVATYDFLLEVAMKIQHVQQTWKWLVDGFASYYGVSDGYTKLRYGDAIGSFKLLSFVQFSFQLQIPFLCHGYGYTEDCLTLIYDLLSPVKGNSKPKLSHPKVDVLFELVKGLIKDMDGADVDEIICNVRKHTMVRGPKRLPFTVHSLDFSALKNSTCRQLGLMPASILSSKSSSCLGIYS